MFTILHIHPQYILDFRVWLKNTASFEVLNAVIMKSCLFAYNAVKSVETQ
jgi:hypothetical protein